MRILKTILLLSLLLTIESVASKWHKLKPLASYGGEAYSLSDRVAYMQIRGYQNEKTNKPDKVFTLSKEPRQSYPPSVIKRFQNLKPKYSSKANLNTFGYGNAFFIDNDGKMFQMDMQQDIIYLLGEIDRPAELQLLLRLRHYEEGAYYRKTSKGYEVKISYPIKGCIQHNIEVFIDKKGLITQRKSSFARKGCKPRKHTQFINSKKVNYQWYLDISIDKKQNLYVLGEVSKDKNINTPTYYSLEKYTPRGKHIWSRKLKSTAASTVLATQGSIYILENSKVVEKYNSKGKKYPLKRDERSKLGKNYKQQDIKKGEYLPEGLPSKKDAIDARIQAYATDKQGNIYVVGSEIFYIDGLPEEMPVGECGNSEQIYAALIAKLNPKGETVWAKVLDANY